MSLVKLGKRRRSLMLSNIAHKFAECLHPAPDILLEDEPKLMLKVLHDVIDAIFVNRRQHMKSVIWHETAVWQSKADLEIVQTICSNAAIFPVGPEFLVLDVRALSELGKKRLSQ